MKSEQLAEIIVLATQGNHDAIENIIDLYMPLINKHSVVDGKFDEDCRQFILMQIFVQISKFGI